ncbi:MAG: ATP-binding protein [Actinomycetes bacterium]
MADKSRSVPLRLASLAVLLLLLTASVASWYVARVVVSSQEERLLRARLAEVVLLLDGAFASFQSSLQILGAVSADGGTSPQSFAATAAPLLTDNVVAVGVARQEQGRLVVTHAAGKGIPVGTPLGGQRSEVAERAVDSGKLSAGLVTEGDNSDAPSLLTVAVPIKGGAGRAVAYHESVVAPTTPTPTEEGTPFSELDLALYAAAQPDADQLLLTTTRDLPLDGQAERRSFAVGAERWQLVARSTEPLAGNFARQVPWGLLGMGVVVAVLVAAFVEMTSRRRSYAMSIADQRTVELRTALDELQHARGAMERLVTLGPTLVLRIAPDDHRAVYASPNIERLFGVSQEEAAAPAFLLDRAEPQDRALLEGALADVVADPSSVRTVEFRLRDGAGRFRWVSTLFLHESGEEPEDEVVLAYVLDIDDRRRAEEDLRGREATLRAVFTASPDLIVIVDRGGGIRVANPAAQRLFGSDGSDVEGRPLADLVHPEDKAQVAELLRHQPAGERDGQALRYRAENTDGEWIVLESQSAMLPGDDGDGRVVAVFRDVTDRTRLEEAQKAAREAAESANIAKSEFLSRMSHELRTPLNAVIGFAQLLELGELNTAQREEVAHIVKGGRHLLGLIDEVLDISRIESGGLPLSPEPLLVGDLVSESLDLVRPLAAHREIHLTGTQAGSCDAHIFADRQRLKQVMLNLLSNAVKYNRQGGTVAVSCERLDAGRLRINVSDTGPGIPSDDLPRLFTPFERLGAEQTEVEGTGIGLALSQRLTTAMGGTLELTTAPGKGTTFWVEFPVAEAPTDRYIRLTEADAPAPRRAPESTTYKILYIEDNLANLRLVERVLAQRKNVEIIAAMQGGLGVELVREHQPRLILLDLHLPDMSGEEVLQRLREEPSTADIPVVVVSADATPRQAQRLLAIGATAYLTKPLDVLALLEMVDVVLARPEAMAPSGSPLARMGDGQA